MALVDINWNPSRKDLRIFAVLLLIFFTIFGGVLYRQTATAGLAIAMFVTAAVVAGVGLIKPTWIRVIYVVWMAVGFPIGFVVSHLLMAGVFYLVVTPIGLIMRLVGRDPMQRAFDRDAKTYWQPRPTTKESQGYFRQF